MSLGGRLRYKTKKGRVQKTTQFVVEGVLDPADWAEFLEKFKALLKQYDIKLKRLNN